MNCELAVREDVSRFSCERLVTQQRRLPQLRVCGCQCMQILPKDSFNRLDCSIAIAVHDISDHATVPQPRRILLRHEP